MSDQNDLVSIIIPTYNRSKLIKKSINSILNQTYKNIEIIVVDDASTDNTKNVVKTIKDKRVKYYSYKTNKGACYARNYGIKKSSGKYISFQDSDDVFRENKIEEQLSNLKLNKTSIDFCKILIHPNETVVPNDNIEDQITKSNINNLLCSNGNFISTQAILAKREVFNDEAFDINLPRLQDYDLILRLSDRYKISYTKKVLVDLYQQKDSISKSNDKLLKAVTLMLEKKYRFDKKELVNTLLKTIITNSLVDTDTNYKNIIKNKEETISKLNDDNQKLIEENKKIYDELKIKIKETKYLQEELNNLKNSTSWKVTKPLRKVSNIVKGNKK